LAEKDETMDIERRRAMRSKLLFTKDTPSNPKRESIFKEY